MGMRLALICSSAEPGQDGVGDYTRRLAGEWIRHGHEAHVIALHDSPALVDGPEEQIDGTVMVPVMRLSAVTSWSEREKAARNWIDSIAPDWISLQFVPFGYHPKGLPWELGRRLQAIINRRACHLMFHELWVGANGPVPLKHLVLGRLQRRLIRRLVRQVDADLVHTTNERYATVLRSIGVDASVLPLFSNIPVASKTGWTSLRLESLGVAPAERERWLVLGLFGDIPREWSHVPWLDGLRRAAHRQGRRVAVIGIGRVSAGGIDRFRRVNETAGGIVAAHLDAQSAERVSDFLQTIDGGLATGQRSLLGKSGSVAAMIEHRVPVLPTRGDEFDGTSEPVDVTAEIDAFVAAAVAPKIGVFASSLIEQCADSLRRQMQARAICLTRVAG